MNLETLYEQIKEFGFKVQTNYPYTETYQLENKIKADIYKDIYNTVIQILFYR